MNQTDKEQIQYLLTQYLEGEIPEEEKKLLFELLDNEPDNREWEEIVVEMIASEQEQKNYEPKRWESVVDAILDSAPRKNEFENKLPFKEEPVTNAQVIGLSSKKRWLWLGSIAAMLIITLTIWVVMIRESKSVVATKYAQQKKITLPDGTEIVLNSNSNIQYLKQWKNNHPREVWLKGEALFKVNHININTDSIREQERFIVHTHLANIEVLGTVFNIRERRGKMEIVLEKGKIKVSFEKNAEPDVIMQPGQIVTVTEENKKIVSNTTNPEEYTAWTQQKLVLTNASFQQIVEYMEDNFGKRILLSDPQLANRKVEGTFKIDNLDDALLVLSKALNVEITQKGDTLIFTAK